MSLRTFILFITSVLLTIQPSYSVDEADETFLQKLYRIRVSITADNELVPAVLQRLNELPQVKEAFPGGLSHGYIEEAKDRRIYVRFDDVSLYEALRMIGDLSGFAYDLSKSAVIYRHMIHIAQIGLAWIELEGLPKDDRTLITTDTKAFCKKYGIKWNDAISEAHHAEQQDRMYVRGEDYELDLLKAVVELRRRGVAISADEPSSKSK